MIEKLANEGLSISYRRVQDIQTSIASQLCAKFNKDGMVCPPTLQKGLFINAAIDNIDHDPSSTGAKSSFHGTSISVFQHVESETIDYNRFKLELDVEGEPSLCLPKSYTDIMPLICIHPKYPVNNQPHQMSKNTSQVTSEASEWINALGDICQDSNTDDKKVSFSAFYSSHLAPTKPNRDISTLLPLINESINSPAMVSHCFKVISKIVQELNPQQSPVITVDQPVLQKTRRVQGYRGNDGTVTYRDGFP